MASRRNVGEETSQTSRGLFVSQRSIMKPIKFNSVIVLSAWLVCIASQVTAAPMGTAFTYQGRLASATNAISGLCNMSFSLYDAETNGTQVGSTLVKWAVPVTNGLFAVSLDFSNVFAGNATWLSTSVMPPGTSDWTMLSPRQPLTPAPYAISAGSLSSNANQSFSGAVTFNPASGPPFTVSSSSKVVNLNADLLDGLDSGAFWQIGGNAGTTAGVNFIGTTDNRALELKVNGQRALR